MKSGPGVSVTFPNCPHVQTFLDKSIISTQSMSQWFTITAVDGPMNSIHLNITYDSDVAWALVSADENIYTDY